MARQPAQESASLQTPAAQRRLARERSADQAAAENRRLDEEFLSDRASKWLVLWAKALETQLLLIAHPGLADVQHWASQFRVDVLSRNVLIWPGQDRMTEEALTRDKFDGWLSGLNQGLELVAEHLAEQERERLQKEADAALRRSTIESLTTEQLRVLGIARSR